MIRLVTLLLATQLTAVWGWVRPTLLNRLPSHLQGATFTSRPTGLQTPVSEWDETISAIASRYVESKYAACDKDGENCVALRDRDEITVLLREILPPVSTSELNKEVDDLMKLFGDEKSIAIDKFVEAVKNNPYWGEAGELVVKELIYLDAVMNDHVYDKSVLNDDDYDDLKESLTWDGSELVNLSGQEAKFLHAVGASRKGLSMLSDAEYGALKAELKANKSWVALRELDPLERLGLNTLVGYIHRSLAIDEKEKSKK
eukprot:CAMPEP_0172612294 /NCGR_PEP_ID=MMETSP1068-20121228/32189_1 /TAXON_ID=35684 /ORGANISM="Pseudopedinella elastica, Strain CCMP716" /LENGTH=258 /DNA_ID=CAMNT_0013416453 /DNA_START=32 /DNA_END=808 /DNA_ORIENTATION=+